MYDLKLPKHWMKEFFIAQTNVDLTNADDALAVYESLKTAGFEKSYHIKTQEAVAHHNRRGNCFMIKLNPNRFVGLFIIINSSNIILSGKHRDEASISLPSSSL